MKATRALVLSSEYADTGSYVRALQLAQALRRMGHEVTSPDPPAFRRRLRAEMLASMARYTAASAKGRYDVIVALKPYPNAAFPAVVKPRQRNCLSVIDIDDMDAAYQGGWRSSAIGLVQSPFPGMADLVTYHNEALARYLVTRKGILPAKLWRLEQGVDTSVFNPELPELAFHYEKALADNRKLIVNVGHFDAAADLGELIWAISLAAEDDPGIKAVLAGGGPLLSAWTESVRRLGLGDLISFTGPIPQGTVAKLIAEANTCTVFYKQSEANMYRSSIKLREYLAMGKKVVCTDVGELSSFAPFTYQTEPDVAAFADELCRAVSIEESRRAQRGQRYVSCRFSWDKIARDFVDRLEVCR